MAFLRRLCGPSRAQTQALRALDMPSWVVAPPPPWGWLFRPLKEALWRQSRAAGVCCGSIRSCVCLPLFLRTVIPLLPTCLQHHRCALICALLPWDVLGHTLSCGVVGVPPPCPLELLKAGLSHLRSGGGFGFSVRNSDRSFILVNGCILIVRFQLGLNFCLAQENCRGLD